MERHPLRSLCSWAQRCRHWLLFGPLSRLLPGLSGVELIAIAGLVILLTTGMSPVWFQIGLPLGLVFLGFALFLQLVRLLLRFWPSPFFRSDGRTETSLGGYFAVQAFGRFLPEHPSAQKWLSFAWSPGIVYVTETCTVFEVDALSWPSVGWFDWLRWPMYLVAWPLILWRVLMLESGSNAWERRLRFTVKHELASFGEATLLWRGVPAIRVETPDCELVVAISGVPAFAQPDGPLLPEPAEPDAANIP